MLARVHGGNAALMPCPTIQQLAAYIDRQSLSLAERQHIEEHILRCRSCLSSVAATLRTLGEIDQATFQLLRDGDK